MQSGARQTCLALMQPMEVTSPQVCKNKISSNGTAMPICIKANENRTGRDPAQPRQCGMSGGHHTKKSKGKRKATFPYFFYAT